MNVAIISTLLVLSLAGKLSLAADCACAGVSPCPASCDTSVASMSFSTALSVQPLPNATSATVAVIQGYRFTGAVEILVDLCAPQSTRQQRLTIDISRNSFADAVTITMQNSCGSDTATRRVPVYVVLFSYNNMSSTSTNGALILRGTLSFGHWIDVSYNMISVVVIKNALDVSQTLQVDGLSLRNLVIGSPDSVGGSDWSWGEISVSSNFINITNVITSSSFQARAAIVCSGIVMSSMSTQSSYPQRSRTHVATNEIRLALYSPTSSPSSLQNWNSSRNDDLPGTFGDALIGISFSNPSSANVTLLTLSIVDVSSNTIVLSNPNSSCYGLWLGHTSETLTPSSSPWLDLRGESRFIVLANLIRESYVRSCRFVFVVSLPDSVSVSSWDSVGSGTLRIESNQLFNIDKTQFTSGGGIAMTGSAILVGFNSMLSVRYNRIWGFPLREGNISIPSSLAGGAFLALSFVPFNLNTGVTLPARLDSRGIVQSGSESLVIVDSNRVYVKIEVPGHRMQVALTLRGFTMAGSRGSVRITQNYFYSFTPGSLYLRNHTELYGSIAISGSSNSFSFSRNAFNEINSPVFGIFPGGASAAFPVPSAGSRVVFSCSSTALFSEDSTSTLGSLADQIFNKSQYASLVQGYLDMSMNCLLGSCTKDIACFAPGTVEVITQPNGNSFPNCLCRCGMGYSVNRLCAPPHGLNSETITMTNGTEEMTLTVTQSVTSEMSSTDTRSRATSTLTQTVTTSQSVSESSSVTPTKSKTVSETVSLSPCYNITAWDTRTSWPFIQKGPNYFYGNLTYDDLHNGNLEVNLSMVPPVRIGQYYNNFNVPNWNSPNFSYNFNVIGVTTPTDAMKLVANRQDLGKLELILSVHAVSTSKYEPLTFKWMFAVTNAVCPLQSYEFEVELFVKEVKVLLANQTRSVTAATMFVAAIHSNMLPAAIAARLPFLTTAVACWGPMTSFEDSVSMTFFRFGSYRGQYARGGVIGNFIAVVVVVLLYMVCALAYALVTHVKSFSLAFQNALEALHVKTAFVGVWLCVLQPTLSAGIALIRNPYDSGDLIIGAVGVALSGVITVLLFVKIVAYPPDVVLVYDLIRPHRPLPSRVMRFLRHVFWAKYHYLCVTDQRRKVERVLLKGKDDPEQSANDTADAADKKEKTEENEEDNDKLLGLLKMTVEECEHAKRWEREKKGDILLLPPPLDKSKVKPEDEMVLSSLMKEHSTKMNEEQEDDAEALELGEVHFTDVARQVESELSNELLFETRGRGEEDTAGLGIITENERLAANAKRDKPMTLMEMQRMQRMAELEEAREAAKKVREEKIAEIKAKIAAELAAREDEEREKRLKAEERVILPLMVLELMRQAPPEKHVDWNIIKYWRDPRMSASLLVVSTAIGIAYGFADDFCLPSGVTVTASYALELIAFAALKGQVQILPYHTVWIPVALCIGLASSISLLVGQHAQVNVALDVSSGLGFALAVWCLIRVALDGAITLFHARVNSEKSMSLIARDQEILVDDEVELPYVPPPPPVKPVKAVKVIEEEAVPETPAPIIAAPVALDNSDDEYDDDYEYDPNRIFNPLGEDLVKEVEDEEEQ